MSKQSVRAREIADLRDQIRLKKSTITNLKGAESSIEKERAQITVQIKELQENAQKELRVIGKQGQKLKQHFEALNKTRSDLKKRFTLLKEEYEEKSKSDATEAASIKELAREVYNDLSANEEERSKVMERLTNFQSHFNQLKEDTDSKLQKQRQAVNEFSEKLSDYQNKIKSLDRDIKKLEQQILEKQGRKATGTDENGEEEPIRIDADGNIIEPEEEEEVVDPQKVIHMTKYGKPEEKEKPPKAPGPIVRERPTGTGLYKFGSDALLAVLRMNIVNAVRTSRTIIKEATDEDDNRDLSLTGWENFSVGRFVAESYIYFRIAVDATLLIFHKTAENEAFQRGIGEVPSQQELSKEWFQEAEKLLDSLGVTCKKLGVVVPTKFDIKQNTTELLTGKRTALLPKGYDLEQAVPKTAPIIKQISANPKSARNTMVNQCFQLIKNLYDFFANNSAVLIDSFGTIAHGDTADEIALAKETQRISSLVNSLAEEGKILSSEIRLYEMIDPRYKSIVSRFRKQEKLRKSDVDEDEKKKRKKGAFAAASIAFIIMAVAGAVLKTKEILSDSMFILSIFLVFLIPLILFLFIYNKKTTDEKDSAPAIPPEELKHLETALLKLGESGNRLKAILRDIQEHLKGLPNLQDIRLR